MTPDEALEICRGTLPDLLGMEFTSLGPERVAARLDLRPDHFAPNGYLHGSTVTALAETACGFGTSLGRPADQRSRFATVELSCNFVGTASAGAIVCEAVRAHAGRTTEVWDARVWREEDERMIALFRLTQMLLDG